MEKIIDFDDFSTTFKPKSFIRDINRYYLKESSNSRRGDYGFCYQANKTINEYKNKIPRNNYIN